MSKKNTYAHYQDYDQLVELMHNSTNSYDYDKVRKAYEVATLAHGDQRRVSGVPYILHPTSVACILVELGMDSESIVAALLHDVVEDTPTTLDEIKREFGVTVTQLIDGLTKLKKIPFSNREEQQAENVRKMLIAMANDIRVIIIKLADRLHNMRTIDCMREQKRRDIALETMEVFAPIAHRLGMKAVKEELEDHSIRYLDPIGYQEIESTLSLRENERNSFIEEIKEKIYNRVREVIPNVHISGRVKSVLSIYRKTYMQGRSLDQIYDIFAVRVIVDSVNDCYNVLGIIHDIFRPLPNRFKDYISTPKPNMYQSLHTTVFDMGNIPFEVQIRTWEMHHTAEYGIAAHWKYKAGVSKTKDDSLESHLSWVRKMLQNELESDDKTDIVKNIKNDLNPHEVYVFTPKGDVITLPHGATVIDMAYAIHSAVGNRMIGAKADGRIVPIDYKVKTGEIVEILTKKEGTGPKRDWLKIVKTSEARSKIRSWFKKERREENIIEGKAEFEKELKKAGIHLSNEDLHELLSQLSAKQHLNSIDDFFASIGYGGIQLWKLMPRIKDIYQKKFAVLEPNYTEIKQQTEKRQKVGSGVVIEGVDDCLIKFSRCCNPLPGDEIIGFITRGFGVSIHKRSCTNVPENLNDCDEPGRWVNAHWEGEIKDIFKSTLEIVAIDRTGLLADVTIQLSSMNISIHSLNSRELPQGQAIVTATIDVNGIDHLKGVMSRLGNINGIISITRS